ncbi:MAG: hypothetical protein JWN40_106, partial [Phycisphaerales bacterium]|nr:hypothetical protein [Phycisphaerales bacterium]
GRPNGTGTSVTTTAAPDADHRAIRITGLNGMHDDGGKANFFGVLGTLQANAFTSDAAGQKARQIADKYVAYIFPKAGSNPLSPASKREDELIPLNNGYFSNDPTNIWREAFVNYVPGSMDAGAGKALAANLIQRNGVDADGTPFLRTIDDVKNAAAAGIVTITLRADDGSQGAPWFICAVFKDFTHGAITPDTTVTFVHNADGTIPAGERDIKDMFDQAAAGVI